MKILKRAQRLKSDKSWSLIKMKPNNVSILNKFGLFIEDINLALHRTVSVLCIVRTIGDVLIIIYNYKHQ